MNLASLDLNLLVALDALLEQRSVTRAAAQMGLSQPALSASLARLRRQFDDPLLVRVGNDYRLTPLALQLKDRVRVALSSVERVYTAQSEFDPATSRREFVVLASDYWAAVFGGATAGLLAAEAPNVRLRIVLNTPGIVDSAHQWLIGADLMMMPHGFLSGLSHQDLFVDEWVCVVSADNPEVGERLSVEQLQQMPWVVTLHGPTASTPAMRRLRMMGVEPEPQVITETFLTVPALVVGSRRVAVLQRRLWAALPQNMGLRALECPLDLGPLHEAMWWHSIHDDDPEHLYLRDVAARAVSRAEHGSPVIDAVDEGFHKD
jgi:DNA-binding transcriptional LysR family regulator